MERQFTKISYNPKTQQVRINWQVENGTDEPDEHTMKVRQPPHQDLIDRINNLAPEVLELCELSGVKQEEIEVRGVSLNWKHGVMGATITALRQLKRSNSPLVLNTPFKTIDHYSEEGGDDSQLLPPDTIERLEALIGEAETFVDGKRGEKPQRDLFEDEEEEEHEAGMTVTVSAGGKSVTTDLKGIRRASRRAGELAGV